MVTDLCKNKKKENIELKERLAKYENPKNSRNSSVPPSKDENRPFKTKSLREQAGKILTPFINSTI